MSAQPIDPTDVSNTGSYDVIHLGDQAAVVVLLYDFMRLRALERSASLTALEDAEDAAAVQEFRARDAASATVFVPGAEVWRRLGLTG